MSRNSRRALATAVVGVFAIAPLVTACAAGRHPQSAMPTQLAEGVNASVHALDVRNAFVLGPAPGKKLAAGGDAPLYAWFANNAASPDRLIAAEAPGVAQSVQIAGGALTLPPGRLVNTVEKPGTTPSSPASSPTPTPPKTPAKTPAKTPGKTAGRTRTPSGGDAPNTTSTPPQSPLTPAAGTTPTGSTPTGATTPTAAPSASSTLILKGLAGDYSGGETVRVTLHFQQAGTLNLTLPVVPWNGYYSTYSPAPAAPPAPPAAPTMKPQSTPPGSTPTATAAKAHKTKKTRKKAAATPSA
ncbi:hypothetical protein OG417_46580 [Actinoallomurus sp. NBC_01490]|uniref:hypothetical protein n=1 Tax=Actinoallomurus sp. NBC_01490 TaxID=2903557 RepID=UPI002E35737C|nr:hypothetical protein [Actinoallomurus sp. NBC_01490]